MGKKKKKKPRSTGKPYQKLVAEIFKIFDPGAKIDEGVWVKGPDGRLDMDVSIRGTIASQPALIVIECKDYDIKRTGKVGRELVDALDSKRHDLGVTMSFICSNSGFTEDAINKGRRKGINLITILKRNDELVKVTVTKELILRKNLFEPFTFTFHRQDGKDEVLSQDTWNKFEYKGGFLSDWLIHRAIILATANPSNALPLIAKFRFKEPIEFVAPHTKTTLVGATVRFKYTIVWLSQIVEINSEKGIYDFIRERLFVAPGPNNVSYAGINWETAKVIEAPEDINILNRKLSPHEFTLDLIMNEGIPNTGDTKPQVFDEISLPEDLDLRLQDPPDQSTP